MAEFLALALEAQALGEMVAAAETHHVIAESAQEFHAGLGIGGVAELASGQGVLGGDIGG
jgi:hypothetical protein